MLDAAIEAALGLAPPKADPEDVARQMESFWMQVQQAFTVDRSLINLNNGGVSPSPRIVQDAMRRYLEFSNQAPTITIWQVLEPEIEGVRRRLCRRVWLRPRRDGDHAATHQRVLEICQLGLDLKRGDEVLVTNQDYPRMMTSLRQRERREGIMLKQISFPVRLRHRHRSHQLYANARSLPNQVILVCHMTNLTGQIFPIKRIVAMAHTKNAASK